MISTVLVIGGKGELGAPAACTHSHKAALANEILDRTVLRGRLRGTLNLMRDLQQSGERGDPTEANRLLGTPTTDLVEWCAHPDTP